MTTFIHEPDGEGEPTIWVAYDGTDRTHDAALRRCELTPAMRDYWDELVERITGEKPDIGKHLADTLREVAAAPDGRDDVDVCVDCLHPVEIHGHAELGCPECSCWRTQFEPEPTEEGR